MKTRIVLGLIALAVANAAWFTWRWAEAPVPATAPTSVQCVHLGPCGEGWEPPVVPWEQRWRAAR